MRGRPPAAPRVDRDLAILICLNFGGVWIGSSGGGAASFTLFMTLQLGAATLSLRTFRSMRSADRALPPGGGSVVRSVGLGLAIGAALAALPPLLAYALIHAAVAGGSIAGATEFPPVVTAAIALSVPIAAIALAISSGRRIVGRVRSRTRIAGVAGLVPALVLVVLAVPSIAGGVLDPSPAALRILILLSAVVISVGVWGLPTLGLLYGSETARRA